MQVAYLTHRHKNSPSLLQVCFSHNRQDKRLKAGARLIGATDQLSIHALGDDSRSYCVIRLLERYRKHRADLWPASFLRADVHNKAMGWCSMYSINVSSLCWRTVDWVEPLNCKSLWVSKLHILLSFLCPSCVTHHFKTVWKALGIAPVMPLHTLCFFFACFRFAMCTAPGCLGRLCATLAGLCSTALFTSPPWPSQL